MTPFWKQCEADPPEHRPRADDGGLQDRVPAADRQEAADRPKWKKARFLFNGRRPEPLPSYLGTVEDPRPEKLGICCSGGGIRSAAFSLGALQALQERKELRRASYLAAVSGGSYIAAAISMVAKRGPKDSDPRVLPGDPPLPAFAPGSPEEQYLRNRCSYLAPSLMDKIYLGIRIVLGLLLNVAFVSLPLVGIALILTGWLYAPQLPALTGSSILIVDYQTNLPGWFTALPAWILAASVVAALCTLLFRWRHDEWQRFFATWATRLLLAAAVFAIVLIGVPYLVEWLRDAGNAHSAKTVASENLPKIGATTLALLAGVAAQLGQFLRSKPVQEDAKWAKTTFAKLGSKARLALAYAAGALFGPLLLVLIFAITVATGMSTIERGSGVDWGFVKLGVGILGAFAFIYSIADLTTWSLHPYYKRRLASAFALKRVKPGLEGKEANRQEAVGSSAHGIAVERDFYKLVPISETALDESKDDGAWPTLIVCAAANISDTAATPPGRAVTSFTFSANSVGGPLVGAIEMSALEGAFDGGQDERPGRGVRARLRWAGRWVADLITGRKHRHHDLSLPAAVAMSGAAISPSMGKMTARPLRFLMALANIRLGVWVPNPRWVAANSAKGLPARLARPRPSYLLREFLGLNSVGAKYLYVTDGGHYENLGLVELLRRGCTEIYCLDASGVSGDGSEFGALGEAIALARSELGVEIEFGTAKEPTRNPEALTPDKKTSFAERDVVIGRIAYPPKSPGQKGAPGKLVYVRNTMTESAPWDVRAHHESDHRFPNNPTIDQLYTDQKFEAYRVLGFKAGAHAFELLNDS